MLIEHSGFGDFCSGFCLIFSTFLLLADISEYANCWPRFAIDAEVAIPSVPASQINGGSRSAGVTGTQRRRNLGADRASRLVKVSDA